jgi:cobalt-precorrin-5B (C1)-methyltransferase
MNTVESNRLREGITTGTCAAAAAQASVRWQLTGRCPERVDIDTPSGKRISLDIFPKNFPACGVKKDAGDDPDVTDGCEVIVAVLFSEDTGNIRFTAGEGVGRVTKPGLKLPVGEAAINPVPRQMIEKEIRHYAGDVGAEVIVSIPGGNILAEKTFNPRLGIEGGLSILGTSGIVRPMSETAVVESLKACLCVAAASEPEYICLVPGETGERRMREWLSGQNKPLERVAFVQMSNYVGLMLDEAVRLNIKKILIGGFAGKLVKLAADIMNTHSHIADGRMEILCTFAAMAGADAQTVKTLYDCRTVTEAEAVLKNHGLEGIWQPISDRAADKCCLRMGKNHEAAVVLLDESGKLLAKSQNTEALTG